MPTHLGQQLNPAIIKLVIGQHFKYFFILLLLIATSVLPPAARGMAQSAGGHTVFGDFRVDEGDSSQIRPINFIVILYTLGGRVVARQTVTNNGRYRFIDVPDGEYSVVVESENIEVARFRVTVASPVRTDFRQDILMEWRENSAGKKREKVRAVTVDTYERGPANTALFEKAGASIKKNDYDQAISFLRQILNTDPKDFEAWSELGTAFLSQDKADDAESAYMRALAEKPNYMFALINLGKLRLIQKQYEKAIETLDQAVKVQPQSATANYYLGEAYLQVKKGSKAVVYLREALNLDPVGRADAHLRLAALYNAAGLKDKAALEYELFLKKKPDHPNRKKFEQYIAENKKS